MSTAIFGVLAKITHTSKYSRYGWAIGLTKNQRNTKTTGNMTSLLSQIVLNHSDMSM